MKFNNVSSTVAQRWLVSIGCAAAGLGACVGVLRFAAGWPALGAAGVVAALCAATGAGAFLALRSQSLRRLDDVLARQHADNVRFDTAINNMSQGLCFFDGDQRLVVCNHRYADLYKLPRELVKPGTTLADIVAHRYRIGLYPKMERAAYLDWRGEIAVSDTASDTVFEQADGRIIAIHHQPMPGHGWVATHEDITERRRAAAQIEHMARHDALTGLPNRVLFRERLEQQVGAAASSSDVHELGVLCVDLDRFKVINDTLGHPIGDALLCAVAARLAECVREADLVARLGGDEFAVIQIGAAQPAAAAALAERLVSAIGAPFNIAGHTICVGASVGGVLWPQDGRGVDDLLKRADLALYAAKFAGGEQSRFFEPAMDDQVRERRALEADLRQAVANGELELHYQPIFDLRRRRVAAFEALLRWRHPKRGLVMPDLFIPMAEETGLIQQLGEWVLQRAFADASGWPATIGIAVNLSPLQLRMGDLLATVSAALKATGLAASRVDLEITESVLLVDNPAHRMLLHRLLALGVHVSLDDFGVGYSSLSYLQSFPFSQLKIDRSFVRDLVDNRQATAIVRAIAALGGCLDMEIVAEGIETAGQLQAIEALGCAKAQGYFLGRPGPASHIAALLERDNMAEPVAAATPRLELVASL